MRIDSFGYRQSIRTPDPMHIKQWMVQQILLL